MQGRRGNGRIPTLEFIWRRRSVRAVVDALGLQKSKEDDGGSSNDLQKLAELEGAKRDAAQHLVGLGFRPGQAVEAVATTERMMLWKRRKKLWRTSVCTWMKVIYRKRSTRRAARIWMLLFLAK